MSQGNTILMMDDPKEQHPSANQDTGRTLIDPEILNEQIVTPPTPPSFTEATRQEEKQNTEETEGVTSTPSQPPIANTSQQTSKQEDNSSKKIFFASAIGAAAGAAISFTGTVLATNLRKQDEEDFIADEATNHDEESIGMFSEGLSGTTIENDSLSFSEAFGNARRSLGATGVFKWRGKLYGTMLKNEWDNLSDKDREQFAHHALSVDLENDIMENDTESSEASLEENTITSAPTIAAEPGATEESASEINSEYEIIEEGEPGDDDETEIEEGEPDDNDAEEVEEGEPGEDDETEDFEEGEPGDDEEEEIEEGEPGDDDETEDIEDNTDDYDDYDNNEDPSDFI